MTDRVVAMKMGGRWTELEKQKIKKSAELVVGGFNGGGWGRLRCPR